MKKLILSLCIMLLTLSAIGCRKSNQNINNYEIFGINRKVIDRIEVIHGNKIVYPDKFQKDKLIVIEDLNAFFVRSSDRIDLLDEDISITLEDAEGYAQMDENNYYIFITFLEPQVLTIYNTIKKEYHNCDGVLFDMNNAKLHWSTKGRFTGTLGYKDNTLDTVIELDTLMKQIEAIFSNLE